MQLTQRRLTLTDAVLRLLRINYPKQLAFFNPIADLDIQAFQLPTHLRTHVNLAYRVKLAGCQYVLL
ncbi:hypothetical protein D3C77_796360 [compost metagenome]